MGHGGISDGSEVALDKGRGVDLLPGGAVDWDGLVSHLGPCFFLYNTAWMAPLELCGGAALA